MQTGQDGTYVYVVSAEHMAVCVQSPSVARQNDLVIDKGVAEGEIVVTQGQLRLAPGMTVSLPGEGRRAGKTGI